MNTKSADVRRFNAVEHALIALIAVALVAATMFAATVTSSPEAGAMGELSVFTGAQVGCDPQRACNDVTLELDRETGDFWVRKGPATSCTGNAGPQLEEVNFMVLCATPFSPTKRVLVRVAERADGTLRFLMRSTTIFPENPEPRHFLVRADLLPVVES